MRIMDGVDLIDGTMAHTYSIESGGGIFLVDTGSKGSAKKIARYYESVGKEPDFILITHYHMDHIGGLEAIMKLYGAKVYAPAGEIGIISGKDPLPEGTPGFLKLITRIPELSQPGRLVPAGDLDRPDVTAVDTWGHTPGSTSYYFPEKGIICVGDALYNKRGSPEVNRMFSLDLEKAAESREKIMGFKPVRILPGHGDPMDVR